MPLRELSAPARSEEAGTLLDEQGAPFLVVDSAGRPCAKDGQRSAARPSPRSRVAFDLVDSGTPRIFFRQEAIRCDENDIIARGGECGERRTRHDGEWQSRGSHSRPNARHQGARIR